MEGSKHTGDPPLAITEAHIIEEWATALRMVWLMARTQRLGELRGERVRSFDDQGLNPFSAECGRVKAYEGLVPVLAVAEFYPAKMRAEAHRDAQREYELDIIAQQRARLDQLSKQFHDVARERLRREGWSDARIEAFLADPDEGELT